MRNLFALCIPLIAACGGGDKPPVVVQPDSPVVPDAPVEAACPICGPDSPCTLQTQSGPMQFMGIPALSLGTDAARIGAAADDCQMNGANVPCDWFVVPTAGANNGRKTLFLFFGFDASLDPINTGPAGSELLMGIEVVSQNGVFVANPDPGINFSTNPGAILSIQGLADQSMGTVPYDAILYMMNVNSTSINSLYMTTSGTVKTIDINDQSGGKITLDIGQTNLAETDGMTTGTCSTTIGDTTNGGMQIFLQQGAGAFGKRSTGSVAGTGTHQRAEELYKNLKAYLHRD